jgi:hypothetical protein
MYSAFLKYDSSGVTLNEFQEADYETNPKIVVA